MSNSVLNQARIRSPGFLDCYVTHQSSLVSHFYFHTHFHICSSFYVYIISTKLICLSQLNVANHSHMLPPKVLQRQLYSWRTYSSCFLPVLHIKWLHLELTTYIGCRTVLSHHTPNQLLQQPQPFPYCEIQSPFSKRIHYTELFITETLHHTEQILPLKRNSLIKTYS